MVDTGIIHMTFGEVVRQYFQRAVRNEHFGLIFILIALIALISVMTHGAFLNGTNIRSLLLRSSITGVAAVGQAFVMLSAGFDLSVGGVAVMTTCLGAAIMTESPRFLAHLPMVPGVLIMLLVASGMGAINGIFVSRLAMPSLIVTLATWQIGKGAAFQISKGGETIRYLPDSLAFFGKGDIGGLPMPVIIFGLAVVLGYLVLQHTRFGRSIYAVGGSEGSAWLTGVNVMHIRFWVFVISGFCAGIASIIQLSRVMCTNVMVLHGLELNSIAAVVIGGVSLFGGKGSIIGVLIGTFILMVLGNGMNLLGLSTYTQWIVKGVVIVAAVSIGALRGR